MKIVALETFLANAGLRNYLFVRLRTDDGLTGLGEASLEWQERTVQTLLHEWVEQRVLGRDPRDVESLAGELIRDQYQGGSTVMTAISGVEIAMWDILGKLEGKPVYQLLGGRQHDRLPAYANGWYGGATKPEHYAEKARQVVEHGYGAMKFDPFGTAWQSLTDEESRTSVEITHAIRRAVGPKIGLMIEYHGRLAKEPAVESILTMERFEPVWCEEPVEPERVEELAEVKGAVRSPIAAGERLYTMADFERLIRLRAADIVQMDVAHCGGMAMSRNIAALAGTHGLRIAPHCSIGPVALAAALHLGMSTPHCMIQEAFGEFDVPWRDALVRGWNPLSRGQFVLPDTPGLGLDLDEKVIAEHPYKPNSFPSLWDRQWLDGFTQNQPRR